MNIDPNIRFFLNEEMSIFKKMMLEAYIFPAIMKVDKLLKIAEIIVISNIVMLLLNIALICYIIIN